MIVCTIWKVETHSSGPIQHVPLTIFAKSFIVDVYLSLEYTSEKNIAYQ